MKAHKRLMASLTARGIAPRKPLTPADFTDGLQVPVSQGSARFLPLLSGQAGNAKTIPELLQEARAGLNRAQRREILFATPTPVAGPAAPISVSEWLQTQPGSTRRGFARGRFTTLPKNVFVS